MKITLHFDIERRYVEGKEIHIEIKDAPCIPDVEDLVINWEDFYDEKTADLIYECIRENDLEPVKHAERWGKDKITVYYEFLPFFTKDDDIEDEEPPFYDYSHLHK